MVWPGHRFAGPVFARWQRRPLEDGESMTKSIQRAAARSPEEVARLREVRERYQREKPSVADSEARGAEFATLGEVVFLRCLADDSKRERERQRLTGEQLAARLGMSPEAFAEIEAGTVGKPTLGVLSRVANAFGKRVACSIVEKSE